MLPLVHLFLLLLAEQATSSHIYYPLNHFSGRALTKEPSKHVFTQDILMPNVRPTKHDHYLCMVQKVDAKASYIVQMEAKADGRKAHHILLFGCTDAPYFSTGEKYWECIEGPACGGMKILFGWAKNAPSTSLPEDVAFRIGSDNGINYLVLQVHYALPLPVPDNSGLKLYMTHEPQKYTAGILLLLSMSTQIPPHKEKVHSDINCQVKTRLPIHPFAYRVHAHKLGVVVTGYKVSHKDGSWTQLGKGNPQWPQAFYPMREVFSVENNDVLAARCTFNSSMRDRWTYIGSTANDEMCNFYMMYYTEAPEDLLTDSCVDVEHSGIMKLIPLDSDEPLPPNPLLEEHALGTDQISSTHGPVPTNSSSSSVLPHPADPAKVVVNKKGHGGISKISDYSDYDLISHSEPTLGREGVPDKSFNSITAGDKSYYDVSRGRIHHMETSSLPEEGAGRRKGYLKNPSTNDDQPEGKFLNWFSSPAQHDSLYSDVSDWPKLKEQLGQVSGVAFNSKGNVVIFHRGPYIWGITTFDLRNNYAGDRDVPIPTDTIITLDQNTGEVLSSWGKNMFFMPHGITLDESDNIWITDVALHQVIKYPTDGSTKPLLTLGERFVPGSDNKHFCKPSSVVVEKNGDFFIADGYCNTRILKYSASGELLLQWGQKTSSILGLKLGTPPPYAFDVPHRLALAEDKGLILVADRENGRIQCFYSSNGTYHSEIKDDDFGGRLFAVAYSPAEGGTVFAVNGPAASIWRSGGVKGFVIKLVTRETLGYFTPSAKAMSNPHDIVVTSDGSTVFVAEIGPNRVWKFEKVNPHDAGKQSYSSGSDVNDNYKASSPPVLEAPPVKTESKLSKLPQESGQSKALKVTSNVQSGLIGGTNFTASMIIMALLAIPILLMIFVAVFIRLRKQGKFYVCNIGHVKGWMTGYKNPNLDQFGIGNLLNSHKGFDPVRMEDSDVDSERSDSDIEEYSAKVPKA